MDFIKKQESRPEVGCSLTSLLITPIQRIPRYRLLLKEVLHWTTPDHIHYSVILGNIVLTLLCAFIHKINIVVFYIIFNFDVY